MNTEVTTPQSFQERMSERVRESIGDLITDAELKVLIDRAMDDAFFKERVIQDGRWHTATAPSFFVQFVHKEMQERVAKEVKAWVEAHPDEVTKAIDATLSKGMFALMMQHFQNMTTGPLMQLGEQLRQRGIL